MKKNKFMHLFPEKREKNRKNITANTKKIVFVLFFIFLVLYIKYQPYTQTNHIINGTWEYIFYIYQFLLNQTLGIVHEGGHGVCYILPCPEFLMVINGTLFQWLFPFAIGVYYKKRGNQIAFYIGLFILGVSMDYTSWYMSTAHEGALLPAYKSFLGVDAMHDFHYIFRTLGVLSYESLIAGITRFIAYSLMIFSLLAMFFDAFLTVSSLC